MNFKQFTSKKFEANRLIICCLKRGIFLPANLLICCLNRKVCRSNYREGLKAKNFKPEVVHNGTE